MTETITPTGRTQVRRVPDRGRYDTDVVHRILDEALFCHVGFIAGAHPVVIPTIHARHGDRLYVHGSPASRMLRTVKGDAEVCVTVTLVDGLVLARSAFHHSMNYRSVVVFGAAREVTDVDEKLTAFRAIVDHVMPGPLGRRARAQRQGDPRRHSCSPSRSPRCRPRCAPGLRSTTKPTTPCPSGPASCRFRPWPGHPLADARTPLGAAVPGHVTAWRR